MQIEPGISHKTIGGHPIAAIRANMQSRADIQAAIEELQAALPPETITGPAFCIFHFIHSYTGGFDAEVGFPVSEPFEGGRIKSRGLPEFSVLTSLHKGGIETLAESRAALYALQDTNGLITDEFTMEVYPSSDPTGEEIELVFILHPWEQLFSQNLARVLSPEQAQTVTAGSDSITLTSSTDDRFEWVKAAVARLDEAAPAEADRYEILSCCSHVFPPTQTAKLREVFQAAQAEGADKYQAVDAVLAFMDGDPGWPPGPTTRQGSTIRFTKRPSNPKAYQEAETDAERKRAYCFCPLIRNHLDQGISPTFCNCSSGWFRKQFETALGEPVTISIIRSILMGDEECEFAVEIPA